MKLSTQRHHTTGDPAVNYVNEMVLNGFINPPQVLLMEDETLLAQGFQMVLREEGYIVDLAMTGEDALNTTQIKGYDLLVADLRLPDMDGMEVVKRIKKDNPEIRVIIITGYADIASALEAFQTGVSDYLSKPLTEQEFVNAVNCALRSQDEQNGKERLLQRQDVVRVLKNIDYYTNAAAGAHERQMTAGIDDGTFEEEVFSDLPHLLHQDKMMSLGRLAASVVHEINNPLSGILNYVRLMIKIMNQGAIPSADALEKFKRYLTVIEGEVNRCSTIVSSLLAFSRKSEVQYAPVNIPELLEKCLLLSQHKLDLSHIKVKTAIGANIPTVWGDFNQIQQCVINLIFNAIDAMESGGMLTIDARYDRLSNSVAVVVGDNGCGIAEKDLCSIFEPFFTTKKEGKGLGLGLSTVHKIIEQHGGTISVESKENERTAFIIRLPANKTH